LIDLAIRFRQLLLAKLDGQPADFAVESERHRIVPVVNRPASVDGESKMSEMSIFPASVIRNARRGSATHGSTDWPQPMRIKNYICCAPVG
jgi:hypothetical protein